MIRQGDDYMKCKCSIKNSINIFSIISFVIPSLMFILILNWFFGITPYQRLEGLPLMLTPLICPFGILFGVLSIKYPPNTLGKWSIIFNGILILLPFLYWTLGTILLGS